MSMILGIGSMKTGQAWWQPPQVVQAQSASSAITPPTIAVPPGSAPHLGHQVIPQVQDDSLGRERLPRGPGRTRVLAPAALRAGHQIQEILPCEPPDRRRSRSAPPRPGRPAGSRPRGSCRRSAMLAGAARMWRISVKGSERDESEGQERVAPPGDPVPERLLVRRESGETPARASHPPGDQRPQGSRVAAIRSPSTTNPLTRMREEQPEEHRVALGVARLPEARRDLRSVGPAPTRPPQSRPRRRGRRSAT